MKEIFGGLKQIKVADLTKDTRYDEEKTIEFPNIECERNGYLVSLDWQFINKSCCRVK
jgi:hypothetical protein